MKRKSRGHLISIIGLILVFIGVAVSSFFDVTGAIVTLVATLTAVIGAFAVYIQIRKSKLIGQSSFTIEISKYLYEIPGLTDFVHKLGRASDVEKREYVIKEEDKKILIKYLNYIKTVSVLVEEKTITIETLNNVFAYEFFIVVNNKSVQETEIQPFHECYQDIFQLYDKWTTFLRRHKMEVLHEEHSLSELPEYKAFFEGGVKWN